VGLNVCGERVEGRALEQREEVSGGVSLHGWSIYDVAVWDRAVPRSPRPSTPRR
jgi:hypothetical protein